MSTLREKAVSGIGWTAAGSTGNQIIQFVIGVVLARILSPAEFGLLGMILVFTSFAQLIGEMGISAALIQKKDIRQEHYHSFFWFNVVVGLFLSIVFYFSSPFIAQFYNEQQLSLYIKVFSVTFLINSLVIVQNSILSRNLKFKEISIIEFLSVLASGIIAIIMAFRGLGVWALIFRQILAVFVKMLSVFIYTRWFPKFIFSYRSIKELLPYSLNLFASNSVGYWKKNMDNLLLGKFLGSVELGIYSKAYSLMLLPLNQINRVFTRVMFPVLSRFQDNKEQMKVNFLKVSRILGMITIPIMLGGYVIAHSFILAVFGEKWIDMIPVFEVLTFAGLFQGVINPLGWIYLSTGKTNILLKWNMVTTVITLSAIIIGLKWGTLGVAYGILISSYLLVIPNIFIAGRLINLGIIEFFKNLGKVFFASFLMFGFLLLLKTYLLVQATLITEMLSIFILGVPIYAGLIYVLKESSLQELKLVIQDFKNRKSNPDVEKTNRLN